MILFLNFRFFFNFKSWFFNQKNLIFQKVFESSFKYQTVAGDPKLYHQGLLHPYTDTWYWHCANSNNAPCFGTWAYGAILYHTGPDTN